MLVLWVLLVWSHVDNKYFEVCLLRGCFPNLWLNCAFWGVLELGCVGCIAAMELMGWKPQLAFPTALPYNPQWYHFVWYTWGILHLWFIVVLTFGDFIATMEAQITLWYLACVQVVIFAESVQIYGLSWNYILLFLSLRLKLYFFILVLKV